MKKLVLLAIAVILLISWQPMVHPGISPGRPGASLVFPQAHHQVGPYEPLHFVAASPIKSGRVWVAGLQGDTTIRGHKLSYYPNKLYPFDSQLQVKIELLLEDYTEISKEYTLDTADFSGKTWVEVDEAARPQLVKIWRGDQILRSMPCSTGRPDDPTPEGVFHLKDRGGSFWSEKYQEGAYWWVRIKGNYLFHSTPFGRDKKLKLEEEAKLGTPASHGCVRLSLADARWFYEQIPDGTYVVIRKDLEKVMPTWLGQRVSPEKLLTVAMATDVVRLDPHDTSDNPSSIVNLHIFDTLFELTSSGIRPSLAVKATPSANATAWEVELRKGVHFQDGTELTAKEVAESFQRLLNPNKRLARRGFFAHYISGVSVLDPYRLLFTLNQPTATFLYLLAHTSAAVVKESSSQNRIWGTGPYELERWEPGYQVTLRKSNYHWDTEPYFDRIQFKVIPEGSTQAVLLETGMVDAVFPLNPMEATRLAGIKEVEVLAEPSQRIIYIGFNLSKPIFANQSFRQACNYAVDKDALVSTLLRGLGQKSGSPLAPSVSGYIPIDAYPYNPGRARQLLAQSGYKGERIELWTPKGRYLQDSKVAEAVAGYLQDIGVNVELRLWEWSTYMAALNRAKPEWDLFLLGWVPATGEAYLGLAPLFMTESRSNLTLFSDPELEKLLQEALGCADPDRRQELYAQIQQEISKKAPWIFLYAQEQTVGIRQALRGVQIHPTEVISFRHAWRAS